MYTYKNLLKNSIIYVLGINYSYVFINDVPVFLDVYPTLWLTIFAIILFKSHLNVMLEKN